jgi:GMP synthase (glutamine-hydrolysing)
MKDAGSGKVVVVQHVAVEGLGRFEPILASLGAEIHWIKEQDSITEPLPRDARGLIVMGGPMGVHDTAEYPRLRDEVRWIEQAITRNLPVLGVCLGSQLLAHALGARVYPGADIELGWLDVTLEPGAASDPLFSKLPSRLTPLHWHGDVFELPPGAVPLARSARTPLQAFSYNSRAWGLLFHLEADAAQVQAMAEVFPSDVQRAGTTPASLLELARQHDANARSAAAHLIRGWLALGQ